MKCPECAEADLESKVYSNGSTSTLMGWTPYYDEAGEYHNHIKQCPSGNCDYGKDQS